MTMTMKPGKVLTKFDKLSEVIRDFVLLNDLPEFKEITGEELAINPVIRSSYSPKRVTGSIKLTPDQRYSEYCNVLYMPQSTYAGYGVALMSVPAEGKESRWDAPRVMKFWSFRLCDHKWSSRNVGNCLNQYTCSECGYSHEVDSSG